MAVCFDELRTLVLVVLMAVGSAVAAPPARLTAEHLHDAHVQKAIAALTESLFERKDPQRYWEPLRAPAGESTTQSGGYTALAALALLQAGQSYQDSRLRDAIDYLATLNMEGTYAVATRASLWARLPPRFHDHLVADARWLIEGFSEKNGGWDYTKKPTAKYHDNSIRQFGALALWDASKRDLNVDRRYWQRLEDAYIGMQLADGGWNYKGEGPATGSMTAAGLATLFITQDLLHAGDALKLGAASAARHERAIDLGMKWMDRHFSPAANPGKNTHFCYYLYGVERVGLASGYKHFGGQDWFREGAGALIDLFLKWDPQREQFDVKPSAKGAGKTDEIAFALMFLSRGRVPVAFNKLEFAGAWNNRPRDMANLTRWIADNAESDMNWQIVNVNSEPQAWMDAPVLYVASHQALPWMKGTSVDAKARAKQVKEFLSNRAAGEVDADAAPPAMPDIPELVKMKYYLDLGGLMFAANEGAPRLFADSVERMGLLMYPQYEWRQLPEEHWAYTMHFPARGKRPTLKAISNGVRELIILSPGGDLPATFQKADVRETGDYHTAANVYFYSSELNRARPRLAPHAAMTSSAAHTQTSVSIVRALHEGNWKPEPHALEAFAAAMAHERGIRVQVSDHPLQDIHTMSPRPDVVLASGIHAHQFTPRQIQAVKAYVASGGVVLFETPGGRGEFTASAEAMAEAAFETPIQSVLRHAIITGTELPGAKDLSRVEYRPFTLQSFGTREVAPRLRGMTIDETRGPQVLFSREDITHALLDQPCWGISGYTPQSARDLLGNIVQHALAASTSNNP